MLVGHIFEIFVSFWVVRGRLWASCKLKGVIGPFGVAKCTLGDAHWDHGFGG